METKSLNQKKLITIKHYVDTLFELKHDLNKYNINTSTINKIKSNFDYLIHDISKFLILNDLKSVAEELKYQTNEEISNFGRSQPSITDEEKIIRNIKNRINKSIDFLKNLHQKYLTETGPRLSYDAFKYELNVDDTSIKISGKIHKHFLNYIFKKQPEKDQVWYLDEISKTDDMAEDSSTENIESRNFSQELKLTRKLLKNYRSSVKYLIKEKLSQEGIKDLFIMNNDAIQINKKYLE